MKFSESWLRSFVDPDCAGAEFSHLLTMAGLEVEEEETVAPPFDNVVVGQVLEVVRHPDADRLNVCRVDIGRGEAQQIVCGAPNVAVGLKVPCALPGASLPGDFTIKVAKVRGVESSGMLCSAKELGIADEASGLLVLPADAPVGEDIRLFLDLDDRLLTIKLTPNRADCLSLTGIAREVAALTGSVTNTISVEDVPVTIDAQRRVILDSPEDCPRYSGRVIAGVDAGVATPDWMKRRLERSGVRSISALVDITNYVMLELGQPLHVFDDTKLSGAVHVRRAQQGEKIQLLNEQTLTLADDVLLITDETSPLAMAGIMGGEQSAVTLKTTQLFLESAFFAPKAIAGRARRYGFSSDASHRFERGVDFGITRLALERASSLILAICGGQAGPVCESVADLPARQPVRLRTARVARVLGLDFSEDQISGFFTRLGLDFVREGADFVVTPPSYRFDIEIEEDLIEEIVRLHGYDDVPSHAPRAVLSMLSQTESKRPLSRARQILADRGYQEVINFAFVEEVWETDFAANNRLIRLANPIASQMNVMRSSLIGGLVSNLASNLKRRQNRVRLFETGRCFFRDSDGAPVEGFAQPWKLAALAYGGVFPEQWGAPARNMNFFDLKGELELFLTPAAVRFKKTVHAAFHPGRCAEVSIAGNVAGVIGELHPEWVQKYGLPFAPVLFELDLGMVLDAQIPTYAEVSQQPLAVRDLALVVDSDLEFQKMLDGLLQHASPLIQDIRLFDVYTGPGVGAGKKSLALRIVMQDTQRTLQDAEVDFAVQQLLVYLQQTFAAELRV